MSYIAESVHRARSLGRTAEGAHAWRELLTQTHVDEADYSDWARELAAIYVRTGRGLSAARIHEYLLNINPALELYTEHGSPRDQGRVLRFGRQLSAAAARYREAGLYGHAARSAEEDNDISEALALYEQLMRSNEATGHRYLSGLAALNGGRLAKKSGQDDRANALLAQATRLLEQEADAREQAGNREQAFRCYLCLIQIGKTEDSYENLAEGYLNCIRILKAKADRFFTMQYYYDFIRFSEELGELHSVAELYREAGEYARRVGFIYGDYFLHEAAQAWLRVADVAEESGNPTELVENALLAGISCFNRVRDDGRVADGYQRLATLPLSESKQKRYAELAEDLRDDSWADGRGHREGPSAFPEYFRRRVKMPEIWIRDLIEAEAGSDIPDAIGRLVGDHKNVWEVQRRKALMIALAYDDHITQGGDPERVPPSIIESLGELGHAAAVRPLQALYEVVDDATRAIIVERAAPLKQKEVFSIIDRALTEGSDSLLQAATAALRRMTFPQALDSLVRLFNSHDSPNVKEACLKSIAAIGTDEACEFLLDVLRSSSGNAALRARALLERHAQERMLSALERNRRQEPDPALRLFIGRLVDQIRGRRGTASF